jgi:arabinogalactan endo-1,4-beta-galactosidase
MNYSKLRFFVFLILLLFTSCKDNTENPPQGQENIELKGADISFLPQIRQSSMKFHNRMDQEEDMLKTLQKSGFNLIRLRLWKNPKEEGSDFKNVKLLSNECKKLGLKVLLTVHFSDDWADPSKQDKPAQWQNISTNQLSDSIRQYTKKIMSEINPDFIQIGNEINNGFLWPDGNITNVKSMKSLLNAAIKSVRETSKTTKIILHFAGYDHATAFYSNISDVDYDLIGLSYYPFWHGKELNVLNDSLNYLSDHFQKKIIIVETAYPFTLGWNDWTHNVLGLENQLINDFPATPEGQKNYMVELSEILKNVDGCLGFCYWGGEWVSYKGKTATNGSSWENQAFWDFNNKALPILELNQ